MLDVGDTVPDFTLPLAHAERKIEAVPFSSLLGGAPIVLSFYPLAFTRVCTAQMCETRDAQATIGDLDATVVGFSIDTAASNLHFARMHQMKHGLYCDPNREVVHQIWATQTVAGVKECAKRGWLVVDKTGKVVEKWITDVSGEWSGLAPIQAALQKAR